MKKSLVISALTLLPFTASATSYVVGNLQFHSHASGSNTTSTLEAGHTFSNSVGGLTLLTEFAGIEVGTYDEGK